MQTSPDLDANTDRNSAKNNMSPFIVGTWRHNNQGPLQRYIPFKMVSIFNDLHILGDTPCIIHIVLIYYLVKEHCIQGHAITE